MTSIGFEQYNVNLGTLNSGTERLSRGVVQHNNASQELDARHATAKNVNCKSTVTTFNRTSLLSPQCYPLVEAKWLCWVSKLAEVLESLSSVNRVWITEVKH